MPVNKNGLPFYLDRKFDVIRFGVDPDNHVKEQRPFKSLVKTENPNKKERFIEKESESLTQLGYKIVVDTVTGVNYLESPRGGITPLLDETGKVCIDKISK
ncbi:DUF6440 family protein [Enterococcus faecalis]|uniref:DUF6440 family protein n=1 Tax=Enterococcus faecalis TaxID=1351 RepID=UPI00027C7EAB|nr:DUF6440 family protein [Enterococcus faecalis]EJU94002.1 hypothetical protein HMPREF1327_00279 [Enterococcus faecalis 599]MCV5984580.1 DUF6440 family protein [Enterococcus faecalis]MCV5997721.1 DUF6440 family protein [Enterococcus faecalis]MCV6046242.1 DUF6440 family protein [Enterococcus faecalis]MDT2109283.1 DUF6440 family protein [Enterococcus faecalis]